MAWTGASSENFRVSRNWKMEYKLHRDKQLNVIFKELVKWQGFKKSTPCVIFSSGAQLCSTLCDPMDCSTPGLPVITNSWSLLKLMSIELVMPSSHLMLCRPLLLLPSIFPSIRVFSNESVLPIRWPKYWSFSVSISPSNEYSGLIYNLTRTDL